MTHKIKIADHALDRYFERTDTDISPKEIAEAVKQNNFTYFKRLTPTRSMAYVNVIKPHLEEEVFKIVLNRKSKTIITILPWKSIYFKRYGIEMEKYSKMFTVELYPDCYLETEKPQALTAIYEHKNYRINDNKEPVQLNYNHPLFEIVFNATWETFEGFNNAHQTFIKERANGNETFKVKNEKHKITFVHYRTRS